MFIVSSGMYTTGNMCITTNYRRQMGDENHFWIVFSLYSILYTTFHYNVHCSAITYVESENVNNHNVGLAREWWVCGRYLNTFYLRWSWPWSVQLTLSYTLLIKDKVQINIYGMYAKYIQRQLVLKITSWSVVLGSYNQIIKKVQLDHKVRPDRQVQLEHKVQLDHKVLLEHKYSQIVRYS